MGSHPEEVARLASRDDSELARSTERIGTDIEALAGERYTLPGAGITRYAYTDVYASTLDYFERAFRDLGFEIRHDPVGTMVASNRGPGERCFGLGSHCDSNRNGGRYDGTMGMAAALEASRLAADRGLDLPLRVISFLEEEGSGFGQMLLGSRIMVQRVTDDELDSYLDDDGRSFPDAAREAGYRPERHRESIHELEGMAGWIELHIEQARVLQDTGERIGVVEAIAGYVHGDLSIEGRADHAGATPMGFRSDAAVTAGECVVELERLTRELSDDAVGTVGELRLEPNIINVIPGSATLSLDLRSASGDHLRVCERILAYAEERAGERGQRSSFEERQRLDPTPMDPTVVGVLERLASDGGVPYRRMPSGAAHDTMNVAGHVPSAMLFVPCRDGISHAPEEHAEPADAALGAHLMLATAEELLGARST